MRVFVTGATGVLGRRVIRNLIDQQFSVSALSRSAQNTEFLKREHVEIREGDLFNKREMVEATKNSDAILHLATSIPRKTLAKLSDWQINDRIRVEGTANLVDAAIANNVKTFVCESVAMLYGQQHGKFVTTSTPLPDEQVEMARSAIQMEKMLVDRLPGKYIIFRFGSFYSDDDFFTNSIIDNVSKGRMPMLGDGNYYMNWIHLDDAASAVLFGLKHLDHFMGKKVNVTDGHPILYADMLNYLSKLLRHKRPFHLPAWIARLLLGKNRFAVFTNSYRVEPDPLLKDWQPGYPDFITGITEIINQKELFFYDKSA